MTTKTIATIVICGILIVVGLAWSHVPPFKGLIPTTAPTPQPTNTVNEVIPNNKPATGKIIPETYTSTSLGFSIQHPVGWKVDDTSTPNKVWFNPVETEAVDSIEVENGTLTSWLKAFENDISTQTDLTVDGYPAKQIDLNSFNLQMTAVEKDGKLYVITSNRDIKKLGLASTFRFTYATPPYTYSVVQFVNSKPSPGSADTKLVRSDNTVIIPSLRQASGVYLDAFSLPTQGDQLYFRSALPESDNAAGQIYSYSLTEKKFTKLKNLNSLFSGWGGVKINPNGYMIAFVRDTYFENPVAGLDQKLYIFDLGQDTLIKTITLSGTETFNSGYGALSSDYYLKWVDQNTLEYKVYKNSTPEKEKAIIRTEQYTLFD